MSSLTMLGAAKYAASLLLLSSTCASGSTITQRPSIASDDGNGGCGMLNLTMRAVDGRNFVMRHGQIALRPPEEQNATIWIMEKAHEYNSSWYIAGVFPTGLKAYWSTGGNGVIQLQVGDYSKTAFAVMGKEDGSDDPRMAMWTASTDTPSWLYYEANDSVVSVSDLTEPSNILADAIPYPNWRSTDTCSGPALLR